MIIDHTTERTSTGRRGVRVALLATAAALVTAASAAVILGGSSAPAAAPAAPAPAALGSASTAVPDATAPSVPTAADPLRATTVQIPALGVRSDLVELGIDGAGALEVPPTADVAGWFTEGAVPGELGPTVIAGHVDSRSGPGVFFRLADLTVGDEVEVGRSDGTTVRYRVVDVLSVDKDAFPTGLVYGPTQGSELRLITCGGAFDRGTGHYVGNVVVSAVPTDPV